MLRIYIAKYRILNKDAVGQSQPLEHTLADGTTEDVVVELEVEAVVLHQRMVHRMGRRRLRERARVLRAGDTICARSNCQGLVSDA